jgi:ferric-dicitrate binding protein FerR (iron transport regulator)
MKPTSTKYHQFKTKHVMADLRMEELSWKNVLGTITPKEKKEMQVLVEASPENRELLDRMNSNEFRENLQELGKIDLRGLDRKMKLRLGLDYPLSEWAPGMTPLRRIARPLAVAASILAVAVATWGLYAKFRRDETDNLPAINATLTCQGTTFDLGDMGQGKAYKAGQIQIDRMGNEFFVHQRPDPWTATRGGVEYSLKNEGKDIQVFFQGATRMQIYKNSGITFTSYPTDTTLTNKEMACYGRVLFNVDHNAQTPFFVRTPKQEIAVLGTCFEVHDYTKEDTGAVFCYSGKVRVEGPRSQPHVITARQRITVDPKTAPRISTGDFPEAHWSSAELVFNFTHIDLDSAMKEIAQWYDVPYVHFQPGIDRRKPGTVYTGKISRYLSLRQLLDILERDDLHFTIQGQTILVKR